MKDQETLWKALSEPTRRQILDQLREGEKTTGELADRFPHLTRFAVMKHLKILVGSGLVCVRREGRHRWNRVNGAAMRQVYERWVTEYEDRWADRLGELKRIAERGTSRGTGPNPVFPADVAELRRHLGSSGPAPPPVESVPLPESVYGCPSVHRIEMTELWGKFRFGLGASIPRIPRAGDHLEFSLGTESFVVFRGADGSLRGGIGLEVIEEQGLLFARQGAGVIARANPATDDLRAQLPPSRPKQTWKCGGEIEVSGNWKALVEAFLEDEPGLDHSADSTDDERGGTTDQGFCEVRPRWSLGFPRRRFLFPNTLLEISPTDLQVLTLLPGGRDRTRVFLDFTRTEEGTEEGQQTSPPTRGLLHDLRKQAETLLEKRRRNPASPVPQRRSPVTDRGLLYFQKRIQRVYRDVCAGSSET